MRRINIKHNSKIITKSFLSKSDLVNFLKNDSNLFDIHPFHHLDIANKVWDLDVGSMYCCFNYRFSIQSKARVGNHLIL